MQDKVNILFIEDSETDYLLTMQLFNQDKLTFSRARTLAEGVEKLNKEHFDLILLDLSVPDSFGTTTLNRSVIWSNNIRRSLYLLAVTTKIQLRRLYKPVLRITL